ncbi:MAG: YggU family protein [Kiritimatiellae bacterium]|nr:YggU family protein [Kiritimatiellia bacterium]
MAPVAQSGAPAWFEQTRDGVVVNVKAVPRSSRAGIDGLYGDDAVKVRIKSAPVDGRANRELVETLAKSFGLPKSSVEILGGATSKHKRILLRGMDAARLPAL